MPPGALWLLCGGVLSACAALAHLAVIAGGPRWYRAFGAGDGLARLAERGSSRPAIITLLIASVLGCWSIYAFAGARIVPAPPLLRPVLALITFAYLARAAALPAFLAYSSLSRPFLIISSAVVLAIGVVHAVGLALSWSALS